MQIDKISIEKLFGVFNHEIKINNDIGITIIIGENGFVKTVILDMIEAFFNGKYYYFNNVEFKNITFTFSDGVTWVLSKEISIDDFPTLILKEINKKKKQYKPLQLLRYDEEHVHYLSNRMKRNFPELRQMGPNLWENRRTGEYLKREDLPIKYQNYMQYELFYDADDTEKPKWFMQRFESLDVSLIETQRVISLSNREKDERHNKTVENYSEELSKLIKTYLTQSTELSSKLDRTYPNRLINRLKETSNLSKDDLLVELDSLEKKRKMLDAVGLIEIEKDSSIIRIEDPQNVIIDVLKLYVEDSFVKLEIFDTISRKIEIFLNIINKRFKHKKLYIDKDKGFSFVSTIKTDREGVHEEIPVGRLSSGEQNELVLFYSLLFKTKQNSLILIDEPEVSLHISWQISFISDLKEIAKLNNVEVLIATHSPDIIDENWDLKVELKGLE
ncbi:MAG: AAA family ATPase [Spirochaetia bacterium]|jgi:predicted ATP-binding protein involved in virulence|nr:AAA family ATPase [Spirochaetia bacterium]